MTTMPDTIYKPSDLDRTAEGMREDFYRRHGWKLNPTWDETPEHEKAGWRRAAAMARTVA